MDRGDGDGAVATVARRIRYGARERVRRRVAYGRHPPCVERRLIATDANHALDELVPCLDILPDEGAQRWRLIENYELANGRRSAATEPLLRDEQDIALLDARKGLNMFRKVDVPVFGIIENMSYFTCPHCGERSEIFAHGGAKAEAERLGCDFLGEIPLDIEIRTTSDGGNPITVSQPDGAHAKSYKFIAETVWGKIEQNLTARESDAPRIVIQ